MKESYLKILHWLSDNASLGYWIVFFAVSFVFLLLIYLFVCNVRLHLHIRVLNRDKGRLMQEKDLMRRGLENTPPAETPKPPSETQASPNETPKPPEQT